MDVEENARQAYLATPDPDALAKEWQQAGVGNTYSPRSGVTGYEGSHVDPDYNVLRFGIPAVRPGEE